MIKYTGSYVTFQEVPDEVSLVLTISNCPYRCKGCHSPWLQTDTGSFLTTDVLFQMMAQYRDGITCVCFMGDGGDAPLVGELIQFVHMCGFKAALYTGSEDMELLDWSSPLPDYYKVGPYIEALGGLDHPTTNQRMYRMNNETHEYEDITPVFWKEKV